MVNSKVGGGTLWVQNRRECKEGLLWGDQMGKKKGLVDRAKDMA